MESVHHLMKMVSGAPNIRPAWFFDTAEQGEGLNDIGTHLVDLVQWTLFPDQAIDYRRDVKVLAAQRWPTQIPEADFRRVTGEPALPGCAVGQREGRAARVLLQHARHLSPARHARDAERHLGLGSARGRRRHALRALPGLAVRRSRCGRRGRTRSARSSTSCPRTPPDAARVRAALEREGRRPAAHVSRHRRRRARRPAARRRSPTATASATRRTSLR